MDDFSFLGNDDDYESIFNNTSEPNFGDDYSADDLIAAASWSPSNSPKAAGSFASNEATKTDPNDDLFNVLNPVSSQETFQETSGLRASQSVQSNLVSQANTSQALGNNFALAQTSQSVTTKSATSSQPLGIFNTQSAQSSAASPAVISQRNVQESNVGVASQGMLQLSQEQLLQLQACIGGNQAQQLSTDQQKNIGALTHQSANALSAQTLISNQQVLQQTVGTPLNIQSQVLQQTVGTPLNLQSQAQVIQKSVNTPVNIQSQSTRQTISNLLQANQGQLTVQNIQPALLQATQPRPIVIQNASGQQAQRQISLPAGTLTQQQALQMMGIQSAQATRPVAIRPANTAPLASSVNQTQQPNLISINTSSGPILLQRTGAAGGNTALAQVPQNIVLRPMLANSGPVTVTQYQNIAPQPSQLLVSQGGQLRQIQIPPGSNIGSMPLQIQTPVTSAQILSSMPTQLQVQSQIHARAASVPIQARPASVPFQSDVSMIGKATSLEASMESKAILTADPDTAKVMTSSEQNASHIGGMQGYNVGNSIQSVNIMTSQAQVINVLSHQGQQSMTPGLTVNIGGKLVNLAGLNMNQKGQLQHNQDILGTTALPQTVSSDGLAQIAPAPIASSQQSFQGQISSTPLIGANNMLQSQPNMSSSANNTTATVKNTSSIPGLQNLQLTTEQIEALRARLREHQQQQQQQQLQQQQLQQQQQQNLQAQQAVRQDSQGSQQGATQNLMSNLQQLMQQNNSMSSLVTSAQQQQSQMQARTSSHSAVEMQPKKFLGLQDLDPGQFQIIGDGIHSVGGNQISSSMHQSNTMSASKSSQQSTSALADQQSIFNTTTFGNLSRLANNAQNSLSAVPNVASSNSQQFLLQSQGNTSMMGLNQGNLQSLEPNAIASATAKSSIASALNSSSNVQGTDVRLQLEQVRQKLAAAAALHQAAGKSKSAGGGGVDSLAALLASDDDDDKEPPSVAGHVTGLWSQQQLQQQKGHVMSSFEQMKPTQVVHHTKTVTDLPSPSPIAQKVPHKQPPRELSAQPSPIAKQPGGKRSRPLSQSPAPSPGGFQPPTPKQQNTQANLNFQPLTPNQNYRPPTPSSNFKPPTPGNFKPPTPQSYQPATPQNYKPPTPQNFNPPTPQNMNPPTPVNYNPPTPGNYNPPTPQGFKPPTPASGSQGHIAPQQQTPNRTFRPPTPGQGHTVETQYHPVPSPQALQSIAPQPSPQQSIASPLTPQQNLVQALLASQAKARSGNAGMASNLQQILQANQQQQQMLTNSLGQQQQQQHRGSVMANQGQGQMVAQSQGESNLMTSVPGQSSLVASQGQTQTAPPPNQTLPQSSLEQQPAQIQIGGQIFSINMPLKSKMLFMKIKEQLMIHEAMSQRDERQEHVYQQLRKSYANIVQQVIRTQLGAAGQRQLLQKQKLQRLAQMQQNSGQRLPNPSQALGATPQVMAGQQVTALGQQGQQAVALGQQGQKVSAVGQQVQQVTALGQQVQQAYNANQQVQQVNVMTSASQSTVPTQQRPALKSQLSQLDQLLMQMNQQPQPNTAIVPNNQQPQIAASQQQQLSGRGTSISSPGQQAVTSSPGQHAPAPSPGQQQQTAMSRLAEQLRQNPQLQQFNQLLNQGQNSANIAPSAFQNAVVKTESGVGLNMQQMTSASAIKTESEIKVESKAWTPGTSDASQQHIAIAPAPAPSTMLGSTGQSSGSLQSVHGSGVPPALQNIFKQKMEALIENLGPEKKQQILQKLALMTPAQKNHFYEKQFEMIMRAQQKIQANKQLQQQRQLHQLTQQTPQLSQQSAQLSQQTTQQSAQLAQQSAQQSAQLSQQTTQQSAQLSQQTTHLSQQTSQQQVNQLAQLTGQMGQQSTPISQQSTQMKLQSNQLLQNAAQFSTQNAQFSQQSAQLSQQTAQLSQLASQLQTSGNTMTQGTADTKALLMQQQQRLATASTSLQLKQASTSSSTQQITQPQTVTNQLQQLLTQQSPQPSPANQTLVIEAEVKAEQQVLSVAQPPGGALAAVQQVQALRGSLYLKAELKKEDDSVDALQSSTETQHSSGQLNTRLSQLQSMLGSAPVVENTQSAALQSQLTGGSHIPSQLSSQLGTSQPSAAPSQLLAQLNTPVRPSAGTSQPSPGPSQLLAQLNTPVRPSAGTSHMNTSMQPSPGTSALNTSVQLNTIIQPSAGTSQLSIPVQPSIGTSAQNIMQSSAGTSQLNTLMQPSAGTSAQNIVQPSSGTSVQGTPVQFGAGTSAHTPQSAAAEQQQRMLMKKSPALQRLSRTQLFHLQLTKDQLRAVRPDCVTSFSCYKDVIKRLLKYHVLQTSEPAPRLLQHAEAEYEEYGRLVEERTDDMLSKYQQLLFDDAIRDAPSAEMVMLERMFMADERAQLQADRHLAATDPDNFRPSPYIAAPPATSDISDCESEDSVVFLDEAPSSRLGPDDVTNDHVTGSHSDDNKSEVRRLSKEVSMSAAQEATAVVEKDAVVAVSPRKLTTVFLDTASRDKMSPQDSVLLSPHLDQIKECSVKIEPLDMNSPIHDLITSPPFIARALSSRRDSQVKSEPNSVTPEAPVQAALSPSYCVESSGGLKVTFKVSPCPSPVPDVAASHDVTAATKRSQVHAHFSDISDDDDDVIVTHAKRARLSSSNSATSANNKQNSHAPSSFANQFEQFVRSQSITAPVSDESSNTSNDSNSVTRQSPPTLSPPTLPLAPPTLEPMPIMVKPEVEQDMDDGDACAPVLVEEDPLQQLDELDRTVSAITSQIQGQNPDAFKIAFQTQNSNSSDSLKSGLPFTDSQLFPEIDLTLDENSESAQSGSMRKSSTAVSLGFDASQPSNDNASLAHLFAGNIFAAGDNDSNVALSDTGNTTQPSSSHDSVQAMPIIMETSTSQLPQNSLTAPPALSRQPSQDNSNLTFPDDVTRNLGLSDSNLMSQLEEFSGLMGGEWGDLDLGGGASGSGGGVSGSGGGAGSDMLDDVAEVLGGLNQQAEDDLTAAINSLISQDQS